MHSPARTISTLALMVLWLALLGGAGYWLFRPAPAYAPPQGWRYWPQVDAVFDVLEAPEGLIVAGKAGLFRLGPTGAVETIALPGFASAPIVFSLLLDPAGRLWAGYQSGLLVRENGQWRNIPALAGRSLQDVRAITLMEDGSVVIGSLGAAFRIPAMSAIPADRIDAEILLEGVRVMTMLSDSHGGLWIGCAQGLRYLLNGRWTRWSEADGLPNSEVSALMEDRDGSVWVGTGFHDEGGTVVFSRDGARWHPPRTIPRAILAAAKTRSLFQDDHGRVWLGSETAGLSVIEGDSQVRLLAARAELPGQEVTAIRRARDGGLWMGTLEGLLHVPRDWLARIAAANPSKIDSCQRRNVQVVRNFGLCTDREYSMNRLYLASRSAIGR